MAHISGPINTLPGTVRKSPEDTECDECSDDALYRVQMETDSMGAEYSDFCQEHYDQYLHDADAADRAGVCEWCKQHTDKLIDHRDFEEGATGRIYEVCSDCIKKENEIICDLDKSDIDFDRIELDDDYPPINDNED
jgi:hypothetical protein